MQIFLLMAFSIALLILVFALQNASVVTVSFLSFNFQGSLALVLCIVFSAGFITGVLMMLPTVLRKILALRHQKRLIKQIAENGIRQTSSTEALQERNDSQGPR